MRGSTDEGLRLGTGKEAIRAVSEMSLDDVRTLHANTDDATTKLVCKWRIREAPAFHQLAMMVNGRPEGTVLAPTLKTQKYIDVFAEFRTLSEAAKILDTMTRQVKMQIKRLRKAGYIFEVQEATWRRGFEYRFVSGPDNKVG